MRTPEGETATSVPTDETKPLQPMAIYALNKRDQEDMFLSVGKAYKIPAVALRYFNVYGPRQSLSNPYTGVAAIFSSRLLNGKPPIVYEDGKQSRDFIHVTDIARANVMALESDKADYQVFNVGSGRPTSILEVARVLAKKLARGTPIEPTVSNRFRAGDTRHCYSDNSRIEKALGFKTLVPFEEGFGELAGWVAKQTAEDRFEDQERELAERGLA
jgi:dTDP-L-rhamnose 4-epimerase